MKKLLLILMLLPCMLMAQTQVYVSPGIGYSPTDLTYSLESGFTAGRISYGIVAEHNLSHDTTAESTYLGPKAYLQFGPTDSVIGFYGSFAIKGGFNKCDRVQYEPGIAVSINTTKNTGIQFSFAAPYTRGNRPTLGTGVSLNFNF